MAAMSPWNPSPATSDVGSGGDGSVMVQEIYVDPVTRQIVTDNPPTTDIGGSGILAFTYPWQAPDSAIPASHYLLGNILVEAPKEMSIARRRHHPAFI